MVMASLTGDSRMKTSEKPVRQRLALWFCGVLGVALALLLSRLLPEQKAVPEDDAAKAGLPAPSSAMSRAAMGTRSSPDFVRDPAGVELVPGRPGYDPYYLAHIMSLQNVFDQEPKNQVWAGVMETELATLPGLENLLPDVKIDRVECKTTVCRLYLEIPARSPHDRFNTQRVIDRLVPGSVQTLQTDNVYYVAFAGGHGFYRGASTDDPRETLRLLEQTRRSVLNDVQQRPSTLGFPRELWPK